MALHQKETRCLLEQHRLNQLKLRPPLHGKNTFGETLGKFGARPGTPGDAAADPQLTRTGLGVEDYRTDGHAEGRLIGSPFSPSSSGGFVGSHSLRFNIFPRAYSGIYNFFRRNEADAAGVDAPRRRFQSLYDL